MSNMELAEVVEQLYAGPPEAFIDERKRCAAQARAAGDRVLATKITALRKPTVSAWAVNLLARNRTDLVEDLESFSTSMRTAQADLDGAAIRELSRGREELLQRLSEGAQAGAEDEGRQLGAALVAEIRSTFVAAIADPQAQEAATSGCLTRALSYAGFGEVDLNQAMATPATPGAQGRRTHSDSVDATADSEPFARALKEAGADQQPAAQQRAGQQAAARQSAQEQTEQHRRALVAARDRLSEAEREVTALALAEADSTQSARRAASRVDELQRLLERATREARSAQEAADSASTALSQARTARDAARVEVDRLS